MQSIPNTGGAAGSGGAIGPTGRSLLPSVTKGIGLRIRRSKTDQEGRGRIVQVPDCVTALDPAPNDALREWLLAAGIESGPLFRMVDRWGNVREGALSEQSVYETVREQMEASGKTRATTGPTASVRAVRAQTPSVEG